MILLAAVLLGILFTGNYFRLGLFELKVAAILSGSIFLYGFHRRIRLWSHGVKDMSQAEIISNAMKGSLSKECLFAARLLKRSAMRGIVLIITIWSFMILAAGSMLLSVEYLTCLMKEESRI